jgi:hypothetical protein
MRTSNRGGVVSISQSPDQQYLAIVFTNEIAFVHFEVYTSIYLYIDRKRNQLHEEVGQDHQSGIHPSAGPKAL